VDRDPTGLTATTAIEAAGPQHARP